MSVDVRGQFLEAARTGLDLLGAEAVREQWGEPSALEGFTVGGLAAHLAGQVLAAAEALDTDYTGRPHKTLYEHYFEAAWLDGDPSSASNTKVRAGGETLAEHGPAQVQASAEAALTVLAERLPALAVDAAGGNPYWVYATTFDDFLVTRIMELVVHADDLACSVGVPTPEFGQAPFDTAAAVLVRLAAHRHGQAALVRALARTERHPGPVSGL
ncbi:maleylpyruvate isomerase N-terminal domain-containing protein [Glycomyces paridis]|uniref:Maleylpyruvate isomerase family protein n=1 Tax=Glycomyces paridis TaxID=2126555 RepID=A0A4S8PAS9_9ACTN|nr:maleylpyruvate isomerase N-terminal domain-containing protein [Glycomyces paridis]THV26242.1 maleylpyruvate isomerase family protein [Glycomyces paridis]